MDGVGVYVYIFFLKIWRAARCKLKEAAIRFIYFNLLEVVLFNFYKIEEDKQKQTL